MHESIDLKILVMIGQPTKYVGMNTRPLSLQTHHPREMRRCVAVDCLSSSLCLRPHLRLVSNTLNDGDIKDGDGSKQ